MGCHRELAIGGVDFSGARERRRTSVPLWQATLRPRGQRMVVETIEQLSTRGTLLSRIAASDSGFLWAIDAPFGIAHALVPDGCDRGQPLWASRNFRIFKGQRDGIPAGGHKRWTDYHYPGTAGAFSLQLRHMTYEAIKLLNNLQRGTVADGPRVFPWCEDGRVFEVFPGSAALALGIEGVTANSYKRDGKSQRAISLRRAILDRLSDGAAPLSPAVTLTTDQREFCIGSDDALDSVLAALSLHWHLEHPDVAGRHIEQARGLWPVEGLIVGPTAPPDDAATQ